jgi:hypothetical protein
MGEIEVFLAEIAEIAEKRRENRNKITWVWNSLRTLRALRETCAVAICNLQLLICNFQFLIGFLLFHDLA